MNERKHLNVLFSVFPLSLRKLEHAAIAQGQQVTVISMLMLFVERGSWGGEMATPARWEWTLIGAKL